MDGGFCIFRKPCMRCCSGFECYIGHPQAFHHPLGCGVSLFSDSANVIGTNSIKTEIHCGSTGLSGVPVAMILCLQAPADFQRCVFLMIKKLQARRTYNSFGAFKKHSPLSMPICRPSPLNARDPLFGFFACLYPAQVAHNIRVGVHLEKGVRMLWCKWREKKSIREDRTVVGHNTVFQSASSQKMVLPVR